MVSNCRGGRVEGAERVDSGVVVEDARGEGGGTDVVPKQSEGRVGVGGAGAIKIALHRRCASLDDVAVVVRLLFDMTMHVRKVVQVQRYNVS